MSATVSAFLPGASAAKWIVASERLGSDGVVLVMAGLGSAIFRRSSGDPGTIMGRWPGQARP
jgi:hypothetical protein